jgi:hypothetical protein
MGACWRFCRRQDHLGGRARGVSGTCNGKDIRMEPQEADYLLTLLLEELERKGRLNYLYDLTVSIGKAFGFHFEHVADAPIKCWCDWDSAEKLEEARWKRKRRNAEAEIASRVRPPPVIEPLGDLRLSLAQFNARSPAFRMEFIRYGGVVFDPPTGNAQLDVERVVFNFEFADAIAKIRKEVIAQ